MLLAQLIRQLANLGPGERLMLSHGDCNDLFRPGLQTAEGRGQMYAAANAADCDVRWDDGDEIEFRKRGS